MKGLSGKVVLVTGAGHPKGIGYAISSKLCALGATVVLTDIAAADAKLQAAVTALKSADGEAVGMTLDVTEPSAITTVLARINEQVGVIDVLINNAGVGGGSGEFLRMTSDHLELAYRVNVGGIVNMCQAVIPQMLKNGGGSIVNIASLCGLGAIEGIPASYTVSKFAAVGLTKAIALEFTTQGIRCNAVCPGVVNTDMRDKLLDRISSEGGITRDEAERLEDDTIAIGRGAEPSEIAEAVAYLVSDASSYVTGVALPVAGGLSAGL